MGVTMSKKDAAAAVGEGFADGGGEVSSGVLCVACWYSLRGLGRDGACPECGSPVKHSLRPDLLRHASTGYLRAVLRGLQVIRAAWWVVVAVFVGSVATNAAVSAGASGVAWVDQVMKLAGIAPVVMFLTGVWMTAEPDPRGDDGEWTARRAARVLAVCAVLAALAMTVATIWGKPTTGLTIRFPTWSWGAAGWCAARFVKLGLLFGACWAMMRHAKGMAQRVPDGALATKLRPWASGAWLIMLGSIFVWVGVAIVINRLNKLREQVEAALSEQSLAEAIGREVQVRAGAAP